MVSEGREGELPMISSTLPAVGFEQATLLPCRPRRRPCSLPTRGWRKRDSNSQSHCRAEHLCRAVQSRHNLVSDVLIKPVAASSNLRRPHNGHKDGFVKATSGILIAALWGRSRSVLCSPPGPAPCSQEGRVIPSRADRDQLCCSMRPTVAQLPERDLELGRFDMVKSDCDERRKRPRRPRITRVARRQKAFT
jgi:hypothetical protein